MDLRFADASRSLFEGGDRVGFCLEAKKGGVDIISFFTENGTGGVLARARKAQAGNGSSPVDYRFLSGDSSRRCRLCRPRYLRSQAFLFCNATDRL